MVRHCEMRLEAVNLNSDVLDGWGCYLLVCVSTGITSATRTVSNMTMLFAVLLLAAANCAIGFRQLSFRTQGLSSRAKTDGDGITARIESNKLRSTSLRMVLNTNPKKVVVLGGDGFCGWPTSLYLSEQVGLESFFLLSNFRKLFMCYCTSSRVMKLLS